MSEIGNWTLRMRLLIRPLMLRPRLAFKLYSGSERWILDALEVNDLPKKMTKFPETTKRISLPWIFLLMHHQVGPNPLRHSPRRTRTVIFAKENPDIKAKARILLPFASTPPPSGRTRTKIRTKMTYPIMSATLVSKKVIMPTSVLRRSQKTSVGLDNLHVSDWG